MIRRLLLPVLLALAAFPLLTAGANGPSLDGPTKAVAAVPAATLERKGDEVIIVGSVESLFNTGFFSGPNRAEKVNRARLTPDGARALAAARPTHLAGVRDLFLPHFGEGELKALAEAWERLVDQPQA